MAHLSLQQASVHFPLLTGKNQSLRSRILATTTGGQLARDNSGKILVRALEETTLDIGGGERVGLLGPNGSGKSTLLRVFSRVYEPTSGTAVIDGRVSSLIDISLGIDPEATGRENIYFRASMMGVSRSQIRAQFDEIVEFSELGDFIEAPVRTYSSGMQLRLSFAVSTAFAPEILVMDEWLAVGDESFRKKAEHRLQDLVEQSQVLVIASHSRALLEHICTRGIYLDHGRVVADGPISQVTEAYFGPYRPAPPANGSPK